MRGAFERQVAAARLPRGPTREDTVFDEELTRLPPATQRYFRFMGAVGRPRVWSFRLTWTGRFRPRKDGPWLPCRAWQYNSRPDVARVFRMKLRFGGVLPVVGHDTYLRGHGRMLVKALDLLPLADEGGEELDIGELVTWLNDAVLLAPSMLLGPGVTFAAGSELDRFEVMMVDAGHTVRAEVFLDERGAPRDFSTTDRFYAPSGGEKVRTRWTTPVEGWTPTSFGTAIPTRGQGIWHPPEGPMAYAELELRPEDVAYNVPPGD